MARYRWLLTLLACTILVGMGSVVHAQVPPEVNADWGAPLIDGVLADTEWTFHPYRLDLEGAPIPTLPSNLSFLLGISTNPNNISIVVRIENITVFSESRDHRFYFALDNGERHGDDQAPDPEGVIYYGDRGYAIMQAVSTSPNQSYIHDFNHEPDSLTSISFSNGWINQGFYETGLSVSGQQGSLGNYTFEHRMPYHLEPGDRPALTRTTTFRLQITLLVRQRVEPFSEWMYVWPSTSNSGYLDHDPFHPVVFEDWALVTTQWTEPPPPPTIPPELVQLLMAAAVVGLIVIVVVLIIRTLRGRREQRRRAAEHWQERERSGG